jgi:prevent-host-death family protein
MPEAVSISLSAEPASGRLPDAVARVERGDGRIVLTRDGKPIAAVVPITDLRALEELDGAEDAYWSRVADEAIAQWEAEGRPAGVSHEELLSR